MSGWINISRDQVAAAADATLPALIAYQLNEILRCPSCDDCMDRSVCVHYPGAGRVPRINCVMHRSDKTQA